MSDSKEGRIAEFMRRAIGEVAAEMALQQPASAEWLKGNLGALQAKMAWHVAHDKYRLLELADIFEWKRRPRI